ncbi:methyltransferase domain-containing protein [Streptomyces sp. YIM 132580]|uniref:methyltransferase domain-containing protein n=1 Tax=Streptomyces sp. YIM 132580 TaxID=2691958 RepID=UPI00136EC60E|nr:methyltransferase domain-containing protein [Streptomyces sp. YIM 132580]
MNPSSDLPPAAYTEAIATLYDQWKAGDNYELWADLLLGPIKEHGSGGRRLLDVGCGTGTSSFVFLDRGFDVAACDIAEPMLAVARSKNCPERTISFHQADMRDLPSTLGSFDVILWMDDVANHLASAQDLNSAIRSSAGLLAPEGLLVFDVNTMQVFLQHFAQQHVSKTEQAVFIWDGQTPSPTPDTPAQATLTAFHRVDQKNWKKSEGSVTEHHFSASIIRAALDTAGLEYIQAYGLLGSESRLAIPASEEKHNKIIYVARRPG